MWKNALTAALVMSVVASCAEQFTGDEEAGGIRLISGLCMAISLLSLCRSFL